MRRLGRAGILHHSIGHLVTLGLPDRRPRIYAPGADTTFIAVNRRDGGRGAVARLVCGYLVTGRVALAPAPGERLDARQRPDSDE